MMDLIPVKIFNYFILFHSKFKINNIIHLCYLFQLFCIFLSLQPHTHKRSFEFKADEEE